MQAYVLASCKSGDEAVIISEFKELPEVIEINGIWGKYDIFMKIKNEDPSKIDSIIQRLRNHPSVTDTRTMHALYGQGGSIDD